MSEIKNGGLDQYGAGPFERQQFGTAGVQRVKLHGYLSVFEPALNTRVWYYFVSYLV